MPSLRPEQQHIADYSGGRLAVSAVPGSGKTHTLAALVVSLLQRRRVPVDSDILIVTFTNSAVDNIKARVRRMLADAGMIDGGYRVFTLHGLASAIIRERPDLAGTVSDFRVDDELSGRTAMPEAVRWFIQQYPAEWQSYLPQDLQAQRRLAVEEQWREATVRLGYEVTRLAKNLRTSAAQLHATMAASAQPVSPFLRIGAAIYDRYERILIAGGRLDFDDLIWGAIRALENDADFRQRLGARYPFVLEDEAQDSTPLQEEILKLLSSEHGNWVRVGDPNQAIMTTFTASDVRFFREFLQRADVQRLPLSVSGRSAPKIIDAANALARWSAHEHPDADVRGEALTDAVLIKPTQPGDPQQNPPDAEARIHVHAFADEDAESLKVAQSAVRYVLDNPQRTCCILAPTNNAGKRVVDALEQLQARHPERLLYQDQLRNAQPVRDVARLLASAVKFCAQPTNTYVLADLQDALAGLAAVSAAGAAAGTAAIAPPAGAPVGGARGRMRTLLRSVQPERLVFPSPAQEPALPEVVVVSADERHELDRIALLAAKWLRASALPIDQLVLTVAQDTLSADNDLAIAHSLAVSLRRYVSINPTAQLADLARELDEIAANRQKYLSNALIESGFEPIPGVITLTTLHKAKGLEWDRVYITGVDEVEFPHDADGGFRGELWFLGGHDPGTEARVEMQLLLSGARGGDGRTGGGTLRKAHVEYISERLRLLYVGITRARREMILSYSKSRFNRDSELALAARKVFNYAA